MFVHTALEVPAAFYAHITQQGFHTQLIIYQTCDVFSPIFLKHLNTHIHTLTMIQALFTCMF